MRWAVLVIGMVALSAHAAVNDIFPMDYIALPEGSNSATFYVYTRNADGPFAHGHRVMRGNLETDVAALRLAHFMKLGNITFAPVVVIGRARSESAPKALSGVIGTESVGWVDTRVGGTLWLRNSPSTREYLGVTATFSLPTGEYDNRQFLNIGENRWKMILNAGWIQPIGEKVILEMIPEVAIYGENDRFLGHQRLEQSNTYSLTSYLRYRVLQKWQLFAGGQINSGGETSINDIEQHNSLSGSKAMLGMAFAPSIQQQWTIRYSKDLNIENGFRTTDEISLKAFFSF